MKMTVWPRYVTSFGCMAHMRYMPMYRQIGFCQAFFKILRKRTIDSIARSSEWRRRHVQRRIDRKYHQLGSRKLTNRRFWEVATV